ncbi:MAG: AlkA N-terminal domain-containing protein [Acidimicrobiales bacterium]
MNGFSAVLTTGIYCRPGCSARPNPSNVRSYPNAAAAEAAGYRACLRCRPYRSEPPLSIDAPELVCRAVRLVVNGCLDEHTEDDLGERLGVSSRHLRRLFELHLGVTPAHLARSRRAHFARRLLDDTDLSLTQVAYAAGFGSVRQFNRVLQDVFRSAPGALRARRRSTDRLVADGGLPLRLPFSPPLDWDEMLGYFASRAIPGVEEVKGNTYRRTVLIEGHPGVIELRPGDDEHLLLVAHLPHWEGLIHVVQRARRIFGLDTDLDAARSALAGDPHIGPLLAKRPGLRTPGTWDPFETAVRAICGQMVSVPAANTIVRRIVERHGSAVGGLEAIGLTTTFPTAQVLASADLVGTGLSPLRIDALRRFALAVHQGELLLDGSLPLDAQVKAIAALRGLGPWSANYLALRIGHGDAFPAADLGIRRALERLAGRELSTREVLVTADAWRPWRAFAATHLWFELAGSNAPLP